MTYTNKRSNTSKNSKNSKQRNNYKNNRNRKRHLRRHKPAKEEFILKDIKEGASGPLNAIGDFFAKDIPQFFTALGYSIQWIGLVIWWFISEVLNPAVWIMDVILGAFAGLQLISYAILDAMMSLLRSSFNGIFNPLIQGIWGDEYNDTKSTSKCYKMPECSVPYPILFATIALPPLGVFMELGMKGWLNILICAGLTLLYYLPGLIYALILLYC